MWYHKWDIIYFILSYSILSLISRIIIFRKSTFISLDINIISIYSINLSFRILLDWYSILFSATVVIISTIIIVFSIIYIPNKELKQFKIIIIIFILSIIILIVRDNIILILLGWDGLGLSSFILVVYYQNFSSSASGLITIFSNRLGDIAILITIRILTINLNWNFFNNEEFSNIVIMMLLIAAFSKRAQFPFSSWLPAAIAAPTPISALVHSSTLVTAGVYILIRVINFPHPNSIIILIIISVATTIYARLTANWEQDIKKIIALSTLRQIGMIIFVLSINNYQIAFFHLIIHAIFKSLIFLCAGIIIYNYSYQDIRHTNLIKNSSPIIIIIIIISNITLIGIPFISGFFSKDYIIEHIINSKIFSFLCIIMVFSIGLTIIYSIRLIKLAIKPILKNKLDSTISNYKKMEIPIILIVPFSIFIGRIIIWIITPTQIFFLPLLLKTSIIFTIIIRFLLSINFNFKSNPFIKIGEKAISLWFINFLSTNFSFIIYPVIRIFQKNDKQWQEIYGPKNLFFILKLNYINPEINIYIPSSVIITLLIIPIIIIIIYFISLFRAIYWR